MKAAAILLLLMPPSGFAQDPIADKRVSLDEEFSIKNGQQVIIEGQKLTSEVQLGVPRFAVPCKRYMHGRATEPS